MYNCGLRVEVGERIILFLLRIYMQMMNRTEFKLQVLKLHIDDPDMKMETTLATRHDIANPQRGWTAFQVGLMTSAIALATVAIVVSLKHSNN
jgi:hypothetical protein